MSADLANAALRSIIRDAAKPNDVYGLAHLRGQAHAISLYLAPDEAVAEEAQAALNVLANRILN